MAANNFYIALFFFSLARLLAVFDVKIGAHQINRYANLFYWKRIIQKKRNRPSHRWKS